MHIATKSSNLKVSDLGDLKKIAIKLSNKIRQGDTIFLFGNLGVGKTTFVKFFINQMQKKNKSKITEVPSPTFGIVHEYLIKGKMIYHYDLFRINDHKECFNIGIYEDLDKKVSLIEWPEKVEKKPKDRIEIFFKYNQDYVERFMKIRTYGRCRHY